MNLLFSILILCLSIFELEGQTKRALLVGISDYNPSNIISSDVWGNIHGVNDVNLLLPVLKKQGFDHSNIKTLCDSQATAKAIRASFLELCKECKMGDIVYIHFSCHGQPYEDLDGDEADSWDEALIPYDAKKIYTPGIYEGENHIKDDELNGYLILIRQKVGAGGAVFVALDACHIGESYKGDDIFRGTNIVFSPTKKKYFRVDVRNKNKASFKTIEKADNLAPICMLEACHANELNMEKVVDGTYYGSLSYYVSLVLKSSLLSKDIEWCKLVKSMMDDDPSLLNQTVVIESSIL